jgi:hypothetical protein
MSTICSPAKIKVVFNFIVGNVNSAALAFFTNMSKECKSALPSAIHVKNQQKTIGSEEDLHVIIQLDKGERIVDMCHNIRLPHSSVHTIRANADGIKESAKSGKRCLFT